MKSRSRGRHIRPLTNAERHRLQHERNMDIKIRRYRWAGSADRVACECDLALFCTTYLPQRFPLPSSTDQLESLEKIQHAALTGGQFAQSAPRGDGKTQRAIAGALWAALYGHRRYIVAIGATAERGKALVRECIQELSDNELLARDWPEICLPIRRAFGRPNRCRYLTINSHDARLECSVAKLAFPVVDCCIDRPRPIAGVVIEGAGISAAFRGLRHTTALGETIRPDLAILDDIQTRKSAMSVGQTERVMSILLGDIKRLAGPNSELAAVCNCTVIRRGDAADQLLDHNKHPQWRGVRKKMVYAWPKAKALWTEYSKLRKTGLLAGDGGAAANAFYIAHRSEMDEGAVVGWESRFRPANGEVSAIQCAYNILIDDGEESFQAECQNEPVEKQYTVHQLTPELVMQRCNGLAPGACPELVRTANVFIDVQKGWLAWCAMGWQADLTGYVIGYGTYPNENRWSEKEPRGDTLDRFIAARLIELVPMLVRPLAFGRPIDRVLIDIGWGDTQETILGAIAHLRNAGGHKQIIPSRGSPNFRFKPDIERYEFAQFQEWPGKGPVLVSNTNWHKMKIHAALTQKAGTPGSITLFGDSPTAHSEFARSVCAERLEDYKEGTRDGDAGMFKWVRVPAARNEMLDCMAGCRVAACWWKITTGQHIPITPSVASSIPTHDLPVGTNNTQPSAAPQTRNRTVRRRRQIVGYDAGWM